MVELIELELDTYCINDRYLISLYIE